MRPNEYQNLAISTQADQTVILNRIYFDPGYGPRAMQLDNAARGLSDDSGEVSGCIKKWIEYGQPLDLVNLKEEVGDCLWRLIQVCDAAGFTLEEVMVANLEKLKIRYKDGYSDAQAAEENRDREGERLVIGLDQNGIPQYEKEDFRGQNGSLPRVVVRRGPHDPFHEESRAIRVGQGISQTGQGWAEPPEELVIGDLPLIAAAHFGDGFVREPRDSSYSGFCGGCNKSIHKNNTSGLCPDCMADKLAGRPLHNERK